MAWQVEIAGAANKALKQLDPQVRSRILLFLQQRIAPADDPRAIGEALKGSELGHFWKYRVGDYRIIVDIQDVAITVLIVRIGNRREVYR